MPRDEGSPGASGLPLLCRMEASGGVRDRLADRRRAVVGTLRKLPQHLQHGFVRTGLFGILDQVLRGSGVFHPAEGLLDVYWIRFFGHAPVLPARRPDGRGLVSWKFLQ